MVNAGEDTQVVMGNDLCLGDDEFPVEDIEELSLHSTHISPAKKPGGKGPMGAP